MILELDTSLLDKIPEIKSINQLVFISLVLNDNQTKNQDIHKLLSLVSDEEIQDLKDKDLISIDITSDGTIVHKTDRLTNLIKEDKSLFDTFF